MKWFVMILFPLLLQASMLDFWHLKAAKKAYNEGNYTLAAKEYAHVEKKSDPVRYDLANSYYKMKQYAKAKALYSQITDPALQFRKWHNIGNCEAMLGHIDAGIKAYEKALKIKEDKDTRYNLELLKKLKKKQQQKKKKKQQKQNKQNQKQQQKKQSNKNKQNQKSQNNRQNRGQKSQQNKKQKEDQKQKENPKKGTQNDKKREDKGQKPKMNRSEQPKRQKPKKEQGKKQTENRAALKAAAKKQPISDKEVRKYLQMLDRRGVNTLMVPLKTKGENHEELKPW